MTSSVELVAMTFDPDVKIDARELVRVMRGEIATLTKDQWEDAKECCADIIEQFIELRRQG